MNFLFDLNFKIIAINCLNEGITFKISKIYYKEQTFVKAEIYKL